MRKGDNWKEKAYDKETLKQAIWITEAFLFPYDEALKMINNGMLGYHEIKGQKEPIKVSQATYFNYKKAFSTLPEIYETLRTYAINGYLLQIMQLASQVKMLNAMSMDNLSKIDDPLERQSVIDSIVSKIIPTQTAFTDMLNSLADYKKLPELESKI